MKNLFTKKNLVIILPIIIVLGIAGFLIYNKYQANRNLLSVPQDGSPVDVEKTIKEVGRVIILPQGEVPTVATVSDVTKLKDQPFFSNAINGDRVLIYQNAKKAFLYRPSEKKIVEVAPVNVAPAASGSAQPAASGGSGIPEPTPKPVAFTLRNGTDTVGLTKKYEPVLLSKINNAAVVSRDNAKEYGYRETVLVAVSEAAKNEAVKVAGLLGIKAAGLPEGESLPEKSDFLIILGADVAASVSAAGLP